MDSHAIFTRGVSRPRNNGIDFGDELVYDPDPGSWSKIRIIRTCITILPEVCLGPRTNPLHTFWDSPDCSRWLTHCLVIFVAVSQGLSFSRFVSLVVIVGVTYWLYFRHLTFSVRGPTLDFKIWRRRSKSIPALKEVQIYIIAVDT